MPFTEFRPLIVLIPCAPSLSILIRFSPCGSPVRRRPNGGQSGAGSGYAATWDQWGVFLGHIYRVDPDAKSWAYRDADDFHTQTDWRFDEQGMPNDAHGDHKWEFVMPFQQGCAKCSAVKRWSIPERTST